MKKNFSAATIFILFSCLTNSVFAQPGKARISLTNTLEKGERLYTEGAYIQAAAAFANVVENNPSDAVTRWKLAETYLKLNDYKRAAQQFKTFYESEDKDIQLHYPNAGFYYGLALRQLANYETAKGVLTRYIDKNKTNTDPLSAQLLAKAKIERDGCDFALSEYSNVTAEVQNMGTVMNGIYNEAAAAYSTENNMYYTAVATGTTVSINESRRTFSKLYRAKNDGTVWTNQTVLPEAINQPGVHNANSCVSNDGKRLYFTRCTEQADGNMHCDLYLSQISEEGTYSAPIKLEDEVNMPNSSTTMPFVLDVGRGDDLLYFASNRKGSKGGYDVWSVVRHPEGTYDNLQNLTNINTVADELSPFVDKEGIVYFSSNGHPSYGGYDVFSYQVIEQEPIIKNLGKPINSPADDLYFNTNAAGTNGFLVSNRVGTRAFDENNPTCSDDIFTVKIMRKKPIKDKTTPKAPVANVKMGTEVRKDIIVEGSDPAFADKSNTSDVKTTTQAPQKTADNAKTQAEKTTGEPAKKTTEEAKKAVEPAVVDNPSKTPVENMPKVEVKTEDKNPQVAIKTPEKTAETSTEPEKTTTQPLAGANYKNPKRNVSADACARACLYDVTSGIAYTVRDVPCANDNNIDFALSPNKRYIFVLERAGETLQSREISTLSSKKSEIFHPRLDSREVSVTPPNANTPVASSPTKITETPKEVTIPAKTPTAIESFTIKGGLKSDNAATDKTVDLSGTTIILYRLDNETSTTEIARKQITADNVYEFEVKQGTPYRLVAEKTGFLKTSVDFTADKNTTTASQLVLREKKANVAFKINNIYYEFNSAMLTPESTQELTSLLTLLNDNQTAIVEVSAHTDNVGTPAANQSISQRRAQSVVDFLTSRGVSAARLRAKGYGATQPISDNKTEASRAKNRRTEFKLVGEIKQ